MRREPPFFFENGKKRDEKSRNGKIGVRNGVKSHYLNFYLGANRDDGN